MSLTETVCYTCDYTDAHSLDVGLPTTCLKQLPLKCTFNVQVSFNNQISRQKDGIAMESPLGRLLADCLMSKLENTQLSRVVGCFDVYRRYAHDTFVICDERVLLDDILPSFNN